MFDINIVECRCVIKHAEVSVSMSLRFGARSKTIQRQMQLATSPIVINYNTSTEFPLLNRFYNDVPN